MTKIRIFFFSPETIEYGSLGFLKPLIWREEPTLKNQCSPWLLGWFLRCYLELSIMHGTLAPRAPAKRHSHYNLEEQKFFFLCSICVIYHHIIFYLKQFCNSIWHNSPIFIICLGSLTLFLIHITLHNQFQNQILTSIWAYYYSA